MSQQVIQIVTEKIMNHLENGVKPWARPWKKFNLGPYNKNFKTGTHYSGINLVSLWIEQEEWGYRSNQWLTAKQAKDLGGVVRKGEKGTPILWASPYCTDHKKGCNDEQCEGRVMAWRYYKVFNMDQVEGIEYQQAQYRHTSEVERIAEAEAVFQASKAHLKIGGGRAFFSPSEDYIGMPDREAFQSTEGFYATLMHELTHWTGHKTRLNRQFGQRFKDQAYAFEELIAEMGSAFMCAHLGIPSNLERHADYIANWKEIIKEKPSALIEAASKASKAYEYLLKLAESQGVDTQPKIGGAPAPSQEVKAKIQHAAEVLRVSDAKPKALPKKHGIAGDDRQALLERLVLEYMTAPSKQELGNEQPEKISIQYGTTEYNIYKTQENIGRIMCAVGFRAQLKELQAEGVAA